MKLSPVARDMPDLPEQSEAVVFGVSERTMSRYLKLLCMDITAKRDLVAVGITSVLRAGA